MFILEHMSKQFLRVTSWARTIKTVFTQKIKALFNETWTVITLKLLASLIIYCIEFHSIDNLSAGKVIYLSVALGH